MKKILHIGTGGTIVSLDDGDGLIPSLSAKELLSHCPEIKDYCNVESIQLLNIDSTNIRPDHWMMIAKCIKDNYDDFDGFVITHGTDTMAYSAAALSYLIQNSKKPIVFTGAQMPVSEPGSDAIKNLTDAFVVASDDNSHGVQIVFFGSVIAGTRARKNFSKSFFAFGSINFPEIAKIEDKRIVRYIQNSVEGKTQFFDRIDTNVGLIKFVPGMREDVLQYIIDQYNGLVIETFGVGGLPEYSNFYNQIKRAVDLGKLVVITTQVPSEGSNLSTYRVGTYIKNNLNILEAHDMTTEAAFAKLMWILGQTTNFKEAEKLFYKTIDYDILLQ